MNRLIFTICAVVIFSALAVGYEYYFDRNGGIVEIQKTFSPQLITQIHQAYPEIGRIYNNSQTTYIECGSLTEISCRRMAEKIEIIMTKLCLDRNGIVSVEVNAQGNIVRTVGDTECLR